MSSPDETSAIRIVSFGYGHGRPPAADLVLDVRHLIDPALDPALRTLDARDERVQQAVRATPGAEAVLAVLVSAALTLRGGSSQPITLAVGCGGGRHRAPHLATQAARRIAALGLGAVAVHRDLDGPLLAMGAGRAA